MRAPAPTESTEPPQPPHSLSPESLRVRARSPRASGRQRPRGPEACSQHHACESFNCVSSTGDGVACDVRQGKRGKTCSPETRSDTGRSSSACGPEGPDGSPGAGTPVPAGPHSFPRLPGLSHLAEAATVLGRGPGVCFQSQLLGTSSPLHAACSPSRSRRARLDGPGRSSCPKASRVAPSVLPVTTRPLGTLCHRRRFQELERGRFRGAVILPNTPSISQGNVFWIYLGTRRRSFFTVRLSLTP